MGPVKMYESNLSRTPPCPGMTSPESCRGRRGGNKRRNRKGRGDGEGGGCFPRVLQGEERNEGKTCTHEGGAGEGRGGGWRGSRWE